MRLATEEELARAPRTWEYLRSHEELLRGRESERMDHDNWFGYVYPKSLGLHDSPKLGIPRLCARLRTSIDKSGSVYLDNVDVNGVITEAELLIGVHGIMNSRLLDWAFRRTSVPFRGNFFSANKQFTAPLPIQAEGTFTAELLTVTDRLVETSHSAGQARKEFQDWLSATVGTRIDRLKGKKKLLAFERHDPAALVVELRKNKDVLSIDPGSKSFYSELTREHESSSEQLGELGLTIDSAQLELDSIVYELYGLTKQQAESIDRDYA